MKWETDGRWITAPGKDGGMYALALVEGHPDIDEEEASRLIAAAPELLAALELAWKDSTTLAFISHRAKEAMRAAIAKAKGKA